MTNIKDLYKAHYDWAQESLGAKKSKYTWAAEDIFELCTYDSGLDERFVKDILEVCTVIYNRENFEYIRDEQNYAKYILVCQLLDKFHWIDWGTSIRGAWFDGYHPVLETHWILKEQEWWGPDYIDGDMARHTIDGVPFSTENIKALIEFMEE